MQKQYNVRRGVVRPMELFCEYDNKTNEQVLKCWIKGIPVDGRLVARASYSQEPTLYAGYKRLKFEKDTAVVIVSASVDNSYLLFGYKET